tara:strand:- start:9219 stop:10286 length:1068 start_codon:yes stop_codon:yes gene_type:complete
MKKNYNNYSVKTHNTTIKDMDLGKREVAIYLSTFGVIDSDNDMIVRGAFEKSIKERGVGTTSNRQIAYLRYHDWQHQIGKFMSIQEDEKGLFAIGKLGTSTKGEDALRDYEDGIITEHSIGFQYMEDGVSWVDDESVKGDGYYKISEVKLFEGSAVTFGANEYTEVVSVAKAEEKENLFKKLTKEIDIVTKALINGRGTDERMYNLEMKLKYLNGRLIDLANTNTVTNSKAVEVKQVDNKPVFNWSKVDYLLFTKDTYSDYPKQAVDNAKRGIELNEAVNNNCATDVGKQRAQDIANKRGLSFDVIKRTFSYLSRAEEFYNPNDTKACGTISYLLWGGKSMKAWCEKKIAEIENN